MLIAIVSGIDSANAETASNRFSIPETSVRLLSATDGVGEAKQLKLGLEFTLAPGWKTYWRSPGDAGMPPQLDWQGSTNLASARIHWPAPKRFTFFDLETYGYSSDLILPISVTLEAPGQPLQAHLKLFYQVCKDICVPVAADLKLEVPSGDNVPSAFGDRIDLFQAQVPSASGDGDINIESARLLQADDGAFLEILARAKTPFQKPDVIVEAAAPVLFGAPVVSYQNGGREAIMRLPISGETPVADVDGQELTLTLIDGPLACESKVIARLGG